MTTHHGERHAALLDQGINLVSLFPPDHLVGVASSYFGEGGGMLILEQSPHLEDTAAARLSILGAVAGRTTYGDENKFTFALSNNARLPDGTHVLLQEARDILAHTIPRTLHENALQVFGEVSSFVRVMGGNLQSAAVYSSTSPSGVEANVSGVFKDDEMYDTYLRSIQAGTILDEQVTPVSADSVRSIRHEVLTPGLGQLVTVTMHDHRQESREAMRRLRS